jgi:DNA-nicking Smr family endonuclease
MKKSKSPDQSPAEFKNNPFKSLKGVVPPLPAAQRKAAPSRKNTEPIEDDTALFLRAAAGARKIANEDVPAETPGNKRVLGPSDDVPPEDDRLFFQAMKKIGTTIREVRREPEDHDGEERHQRSSAGRMRQLKRGTLRISEEIDLHGDHKDEALKRLEHFIVNAFSRGQHAVLVITGKGINSPEGLPVLQGAVATWLSEKGKGMVVEFAPAPRELGGAGAFVVFLKKK